MRTAKIGQGMGDILSSVPYIKALGIDYLYITVNLLTIPDWHPVHKGAELLLPLLRSQGLDGMVIPYQELRYYTYDIDMDLRVEAGWVGHRSDIYTWNSLFYGVYPDMTKPWFTLPDTPKGDYIVFARTARYNNKAIDYTFLESIPNPKFFFGTKGEVEYLNARFPGLRNFTYRPIKDFLDAAMFMKGAKFVITNQTSYAVLAEGLGIPRILEVCPSAPAVIPKTPGPARPVITQRFFEKAIRELSK